MCGKGGAAVCAKFLAPAGSANHAHHIMCVSLSVTKMSKKVGIRSSACAPCSGSFPPLQHGRLRLRQISGLQRRPRPPSWPPRLVDEAGILETSRIFALRLLLRCQLPACSPSVLAQQSFKEIYVKESGRRVRNARLGLSRLGTL